MKINTENGLKLGEPENPNKDWIPNKENFGKYLDDLKGKIIERVEISDTRKDIEISMKVYENINYNNKLQQWEGDVFKEANEVADAFYTRALNDLELSQVKQTKSSRTYIILMLILGTKELMYQKKSDIEEAPGKTQTKL